LNTFAPLEEAQWMMQHGSGEGFQLVVNIINQRALPLLSEANQKGYGLIARMPLQFGLLTGKFDAGARFAANDHRKNRLTDNVINTAREALQPVWELCSKYDCTPTQLALSYVLSYPEVSVVIPGMRNRNQVADNTTGLFRLEPDDRAFIEQRGKEDLAGLMDLFFSLG
jgi:aryl-alcohol dehydrogenase-like predicted oxidoreductase